MLPICTGMCLIYEQVNFTKKNQKKPKKTRECERELFVTAIYHRLAG